MRVDVYSREQAEALTPRYDAAVISISTPYDKPATLKHGWPAIYRLQFHDFASDVGPTLGPCKTCEQRGMIPGDAGGVRCTVCNGTGFRRVVYFDEDMAEALQHFITKHLGFDFVVHCDAGISRSVAVGVYLRDVHERELHLHATPNPSMANGLILRTLMRKHWENHLGSK